MDKVIKHLKAARKEAQKALGKRVHELADSGKNLSDRMLAGFYHMIDKIDETIDQISAKVPSEIRIKLKSTENEDSAADKPKRGRKPASAAAEQKPAAKRGRKPGSTRKPAAKPKKTTTTGRGRAKKPTDTPPTEPAE